MILTLEVVGEQAGRLGPAARKVFRAAGGTIGRLSDNDWVLDDPYVSGHHARIHYANGSFLLEDTSTNGVFVNSPENRLPRGQRHVLADGDRLFIDVYEIRATLSAESVSRAVDPHAVRPMTKPVRESSLLIPEDPFAEPGVEEDAPVLPEVAGDTDPMKALGLESESGGTSDSGLRAEELRGRSPMQQHYRPPTPRADVPPPRQSQSASLIPDDYDPLGPDVPPPAPDPPRTPTPAARSQPQRPRSAPPPTSQSRPQVAARARPGPAAPPRRVDPPSAPRKPVSPASAPAAAGSELDFAALLAGAGLESVQPSPELAQTFGQILRVVIAGLMDVLRARERIKDEFRMRMTTFKPADNNPLKFSADVDDALHNLLVKRNAAYLRPVEAFEDAFDDVRNHQMAMLAGVRQAFDSMLAEFDPERLQEEFERQIKAGSIIGLPGKLRYWDLYRNRFHDMVKDADSSFRNLFGDEFARAYEEQLEKLKTTSRARGR